MNADRHILLHMRRPNDELRSGVAPLNLFLSASTPGKIRVGVWDLGAWLGSLPRLLRAMSEAQDRYDFFSVQATVPVGMIRRAEGVLAWAKKAVPGKRFTRADVRDSVDSMVEDDFYAIAKPVLKETELNYLVGITPSMIATVVSKTDVGWDYLSSYHRNMILVSAYQLREFARDTNVPLDVFLGSLITGQLLVAQFHRTRNLGFHEDRGCLFDFNDDRTTLRNSVSNLRIEEQCLDRIPSEFRPAAEALIALLKSYR